MRRLETISSKCSGLVWVVKAQSVIIEKLSFCCSIC